MSSEERERGSSVWDAIGDIHKSLETINRELGHVCGRTDLAVYLLYGLYGIIGSILVAVVVANILAR